jgi:hypothetical protein
MYIFFSLIKVMSLICDLDMKQLMLKLLEKISDLFVFDKTRWINFYICAQMISS